MEFLGHILENGLVRADPKKVRAVEEWERPSDRTQLRRFLGFANFYHRFIRGFSRVAAPLSALTSTLHPFSWSPEAEAAFSSLKTLFTTAPVLIFPDPGRQFIVEVDASDIGIGAVLSQWSDFPPRLQKHPSRRPVPSLPHRRPTRQTSPTRHHPCVPCYWHSHLEAWVGCSRGPACPTWSGGRPPELPLRSRVRPEQNPPVGPLQPASLPPQSHPYSPVHLTPLLVALPRGRHQGVCRGMWHLCQEQDLPSPSSWPTLSSPCPRSTMVSHRPGHHYWTSARPGQHSASSVRYIRTCESLNAYGLISLSMCVWSFWVSPAVHKNTSF